MKLKSIQILQNLIFSFRTEPKYERMSDHACKTQRKRHKKAEEKVLKSKATQLFED